MVGPQTRKLGRQTWLAGTPASLGRQGSRQGKDVGPFRSDLALQRFQRVAVAGNGDHLLAVITHQRQRYSATNTAGRPGDDDPAFAISHWHVAVWPGAPP